MHPHKCTHPHSWTQEAQHTKSPTCDHISITIHTVSLALLSVVVYIIIKHGLSKLKLLPLIAAIVILWVVVVLTGIPYLRPAYQYEAFRKGILICDSMLTRVAYMHIGLSVLFIDTPARLISIATIIAAAVHVKRSTVTALSKSLCCVSL